MLKKEFKRKDVQRARNLIMGNTGNSTELDKIVRQLETKGIEADHNAFMDVS